MEELKKLANSVDEFITSLIDPLKSDKPSREAFGDSLDSIIDKAIEYKQMKVNQLGRLVTLFPPNEYCNINYSRSRITITSIQFCYVIQTTEAVCSVTVEISLEMF